MDVNFICKISNIESAYYSISVYETPYCTAENAEYTAIGLGENTGTLSFASDAYYYSSGDGYYNAKFLKVSLKTGETYNINYQLSKKAKGAYGLAPYIAIDGESSYSNSTGFADSCSVLTITITPEADGDCKIAIWNEYGGPIPCEYDYKLTIRQLDKASGLASLDCSTEYTVGSVISGSLNADDKQVYCNNDYYGYAEGYSVNVPDDGNKYAFFFKEGSDNTFKKASVVLFKKAFSDAPLAHTEGFPDPIFLSSVVSAGQYKLALMSDQMNSADYKFAIRKVATQPSDIDFSRKLTVGKSQSEYADPFSTQPFSPSESFFAYCSGYSVELEKGVTYRFSTTAKDVPSELGLFAEGDMNTPLQHVMSNYSAEFYCTPDETGTYNLVAQFGNVYFCTPVKYMVEEVPSLADLLNNATELTGTHTAQLDFSKDAQLFDSGLEGVGMLLGKAYKMSLAKGEMLMENWTDDLDYLWFHKDAEGKFQMSDLNSSSENFYYTADADTVLYFVLAVQPNVSNENVTMSGFVCKPIEQLLDSAVEVAQLPYTASGMFNVLDKGAQMCVCPSGVPSGGFCGAYKLNIAKGEYVNYSFEASAVGFYFVYSKVDGEYVMPDFFSGGGVKIGGYDKDTTFYMANVINGTMSPYKVAINNGNAITLTELFNGATEIGSVPFYAEGNSAQNSTLTNIREYTALPNTWNQDSDYFYYANAYKLSLKAGESVHIDYSSEYNAYMLLYSKNSSGEYELIDYKDGGNDDSFYGNGENCDFTAPADMELYIYVAPCYQLTQTNWAFNVLKKQQIKTPDFDIITLTELFNGATEIGNLPFYAEGNSADNSTLTNIREYIALPNTWDDDSDRFTYANAYKLKLTAGESVCIDYSSTEDAYMLLYSKNSSGEYELIVSRDNGNDGSFYGNGENCDFNATTDTTIYIYVAPYGQLTQTDWAFNVLKKQQIKTPDIDAITLTELFDGATEIGNLPFYAEGNSADSSTLTNIRRFWGSDCFTYANAYKLKLTAGESVRIDYSSECNAYMLLYSKNSSDEYELIVSRDNGNVSSFYGNGEYYGFTAESEMELYIYVAPYRQFTQTNWIFNVVKDQSDIKTPDVMTLTELFNGATEIGSVPFYAEGNSVDNSTVTNIREYTALPNTWNYDSDYFTYANAYKLSLKAGESVHIDYSSECNAYMLLYSKNSSGEYEFIDYKDNGNDDSFYGYGEYYDYPAESDMELYIYVAPYYQIEQTDWAFNVVKDQSDIKTPSGNAITLTELFNGATEIGNLPFYAEGNSAQNSTLTNIREYTAEYWNEDSDYCTYANAYKLSLEAGESVRIDYSSTVDAYMLLYSKNAGGYYFIDSRDDDNYGDSFYGDGEYYDYTASVDTTIYIYVAPYDRFTQTDWAFNVMMGKKVPSAETLADLLDSATEVNMNALRTDGYAMYFGEATELYYTSNYIPWTNNLTTTAVAYKFEVPAGANINLYNLKNYDYEGFYFRKTANGYKYCDGGEKLMRDSAGDTLYVVSLSYSLSTYAYEHVLEFYENVTEFKYPDLMFEQEPTKEDVMVALFENNPYFVNCFGDTIVVSMDEIERNGKIKGCNINMAGHELTYYVSYNISYLNDCYNINVSEIKARFGVSFTLAVSATGNGTVNSNVSGKYLKDTEVAISAVPAEHYHFVKWSNGSLKATDTIVVVSDTALVAEFAIDTYNVELSAENGTVTGAGEYGYGSAAAIAATPAEGFHFVQWSNGSLKANDTIMIVSDTALVATFEAHSFGEWDTTLVATCTVAGSRTRTCACGEVEIDTIPALGHKIVVDSAVAATCTKSGLTEGKHCSVCDSIFVAQQTIPALGHKIVTIAGVSPTCTAEGLTEGSRCSVCGEVIVAQETIPMLEHSFTNYIYNNDATTEADGTETAVCDHGCGATDTRTAEGTKLTGIDAMETAEVVIYAHHNVIVVENAETDIYVYEPTGRCVAKRQAESNRIEITMPNQGLYIVKVGAEAKRVFINKN